MDLREFEKRIEGNFDCMSDDFNSRYRSCDFSEFVQFGDDPNNLNRGFTEGKSFTLDPTSELDDNQGRLYAYGVEDEVEPFADHAFNYPPINNREQATPYRSSNQFEQISGTRQDAPYIYDKFGQLEGNAGYEKEVIEHYLCKHHFYGERSSVKNCGLTLWIQRAPLVTNSYGAAPAICLYKDCHVDQNRHIQAGDVRIAFDEKTALGLERDPRINAGYVHLKCLEAHIPHHRQMFAKLNFKVEGRGPHKKNPWLNNPTIFSTMSQIIYAEDYIEGCSKESRIGGRTSDAILLSAGIEKELRGAHPVVREVESKILEMEGWDDLKALIGLKYAQACSIALTGKKTGRPQKPRIGSSKSKCANRMNRQAYTKKKNHSSRDETSAAKKVKRRVGRPSKDIEPEVTTETQPLNRGEGKIKTRMFIRNGKEVWEKYEDPWSPLVSDTEDCTGGEEESRDDEDLGDDEASSDDDEPRGRKR